MKRRPSQPIEGGNRLEGHHYDNMLKKGVQASMKMRAPGTFLGVFRFNDR